MRLVTPVWDYIWGIIIWFDQGIGVWLHPLLNLFVKADSPYRFGNPDDTPSSVMGKNNEHGGCLFCLIICKVLSIGQKILTFRKGSVRHCEESIEWDE